LFLTSSWKCDFLSHLRMPDCSLKSTLRCELVTIDTGVSCLKDLKQVLHNLHNCVGGLIMKVKIFTNEGDVVKLEKEVNQWLSDNITVNVFNVKQSVAYDSKSDMLITLISIWCTGVV